MNERQKIQQEVEAKLAEGRAALDKAWKDTKEAWHGVSRDIEHHWRSLSDRVKSHLA